MKVYYWEVRQMDTLNLERLGVATEYTEAVRSLYELGVQPQDVHQVADTRAEKRTLMAYGTGENSDGQVVFFKILKLEMR